MSAASGFPGQASIGLAGRIPGPERGSARERALWAVLVLGLLAVVGMAFLSYFAPSSSPPDTYGEVPPFSFIAQDGEPFGSDQLEGAVWMAGFMFTRCKATCPPLTRAMRSVQDALAGDGGWALVSFTVDPDHDTPEVLEEFADSYNADPARWKFLTGEKDELFELSIKGFYLAVEEGAGDSREPTLHSSRIILVDGSRVIRGYYDSLDAEAVAQLVKDARYLLEEAS